MKHNWVMKLLVLCNGAMAAGLCYTAYHLATYPFGFPDSPVMRWFERFETLFPNLGATPQFLLEMAAKGLPGGMTMESRWVAVVSSVILAVVTAAVTYGLVRDADWARNAFGVIALLQLLPLVLKLGLTALHLIVVGRAGIGGYLTGVTGTRIPLQYSVLGAFVAAGILRLMWRWRDESESHLTWPAEDAKPIAASPAFNAQTQEHRRRVSKWTWAMRAALLLQLAAFTLLEFSGKEARRNWSGEAILFWVIWAAVVGVMWYFLSREDPRLGVGLGLGCAGVQVLPALGLPILLLMLGFQTWFQVGLALLGVLAVLSLLVSGTVASIILGRAPLERTGIWGLGVLLPFVAATVFFQAIQERGYAKTPALSREKTMEQSREFERGHTAQEMVHLIAKCTFEYATAHPKEGFPESLEQLGAGGSGCLPIVPGKRLVEGHEFEYQSSNRESNGARDRFMARSKQVQHTPGTFSLPDLQVNETGIFGRLEGIRVFSFSPALALVNNVAGCLKRDFAASGGVSYPANLRGLLSIKADYGVPCVPPFEANELSVIDLWRNQFQSSSYSFTYTPTDGASGQFKGFRLEGRPTEYGKIALRSYLADQSGTVHATPFNRAATFDDPDAACEAKDQGCSAPQV